MNSEASCSHNKEQTVSTQPFATIRERKPPEIQRRPTNNTNLNSTISALLICFLLLNLFNVHSNLNKITVVSAATTSDPVEDAARHWIREQMQQQPLTPTTDKTGDNDDHTRSRLHGHDKRAFVAELLQTLYEQHGAQGTSSRSGSDSALLEERRSPGGQTHGQVSAGPRLINQLLEAIGADGDARRLLDWVRNSFSPSAIPEVTTQFVVSKLGSVNCPALLRPDKEETLQPRFLLFNDHFIDVPFELSPQPTLNECRANGKLDTKRKTIVLVHGYLTGYTLVDGMTNIKNRLLDLNRALNERAIKTFEHNSAAHLLNGSSFVYTEDLNSKLRQQMYNVIIVDWFNGANPTPRANYIRSAVNAQVVGQLIARFLSSLIVQCGTPAGSIQILAHSLGCHVTGFTGKAMNLAGHRLGKITHLDPVGLCFGRLFSQPRFRLSPDDALETQAVHTSLNLFDNPLDGAHTNFLVNGGRDQTGCGGPSELTNSTASSIGLLFDPAAKFGACSHLRALDLFEEDHSSGVDGGMCQMVGYRCQNYDRFLAGKCGFCDEANSQCRLMSMAPLSVKFKQMSMASDTGGSPPVEHYYDLYDSRGSSLMPESERDGGQSSPVLGNRTTRMLQANKQAAPFVTTPLPLQQTTLSPSKMFGAPSYLLHHSQLGNNNNEVLRRADRSLSSAAADKRDMLALALEKLRTETRSALIGGWTSLRLPTPSPEAANNQHLPIDEMDQGREQSSPGVAVLDHTATITTIKPKQAEISTPAWPASTSSKPVVDLKGHSASDEPSSRSFREPLDHIPIGSQKIPAGSLHGPLYFLGTGSVASYCLNYYQVRVLIAESRLQKVIKSNGLGSNRLAPQLSQHRGSIITAAAALQQRVVNANGRDMLHLTVKLTDDQGRFFKGFSMVEYARTLPRVMNELARPSAGPSEPMVELTMLLNSTISEPQKIGEVILSYYFHQIVLADRVEINYMSNISPDIRARFSSVLCPMAINDKHQLVRYIECHKVSPLR